MEPTKHVAPPATATEIRRLLEITADEMAAARRLLRLTAVKDDSLRPSRRPPSKRVTSQVAAEAIGKAAGKANKRAARKPAMRRTGKAPA